MYLLHLLFVLMIYAAFNNAQSFRDCSNFNRRVTRQVRDGSKSFVNCIGYDVASGQSNLVIIIDRSNRNAYQAAKEVVRSLLTKIKVSYNATRIAVITFDKHATVDIDFLRAPKLTNHKCEFNNLFQNKLPQQSGSGSNIRGALKMASNIFMDLETNPARHSWRSKSNKVVILLSDGKGTHFAGSGDPKDASLEANRFNNFSYSIFFSLSFLYLPTGFLNNCFSKKAN